MKTKANFFWSEVILNPKLSRKIESLADFETVLCSQTKKNISCESKITLSFTVSLKHRCRYSCKKKCYSLITGLIMLQSKGFIFYIRRKFKIDLLVKLIKQIIKFGCKTPTKIADQNVISQSTILLLCRFFVIFVHSSFDPSLSFFLSFFCLLHFFPLG